MYFCFYFLTKFKCGIMQLSKKYFKKKSLRKTHTKIKKHGKIKKTFFLYRFATFITMVIFYNKQFLETSFKFIGASTTNNYSKTKKKKKLQQNDLKKREKRKKSNVEKFLNPSRGDCKKPRLWRMVKKQT
jgi:hypothetical protein